MSKGCEQIFLKKKKRKIQLINTRKGAQHHQLLGKCKSKPQLDTTSHTLR